MRKMSRRQIRRFDFDLFSRNSKKAFREIADRDPRHAIFEQTYSLCITPGGADGGYDNRVVEVFYGQRPFDAIKEIAPGKTVFSPPRDRLMVERGARLVYRRGDNGFVICTLDPAVSENYQRAEDMILLAVIRGTHVLTGKPILESHWKALMAYMQCTSLEGEPTIADRCRVWWLLWTRTLFWQNKAHGPRIWFVGLKIVSFSLTIGLSGFLLALVDLCLKHK